ncbi:MAG: hypothetical protein UR26_C0001G0162 [candidate division TM6 bacterium GW2011_GWF2_32_72]|nr:MAG: hypothetical protein UR26_C0001G0162 [candidate division TM6 bacterium GW2011_GWF2_32_72]
MLKFLLIWLVIAFLFLLMEMQAPGLFYFLSFFIGGLAAASSSFWIESSVYQTIIFLIVSLISMFILKFFVSTWMHLTSPNIQTNVYGLIGKVGIVVKHIKPKVSGAVKVGGEIWMARDVKGGEILQGVSVRIIRIEGVCLIVSKI